ncbi:replication initiator protein A [Oenococcus kitaharae]|uniref:RepA-like plasmid replication initiation protein n=1 Tax=Oenococcus kitaharae DSM 17330 TaxID=1045004 RepID=G9WHQ8_9LACO|nr:replication initiator protein A [Oenococcus kitaharae]EHN58632.1 RepA-like plasmid replication initiation protein [Oenococcus kitaharae DSM 17330]
MGETFNFFQVNKVYGNLFFQFPKVLLYGTKYKELSDAAKLAYIVLKERLEYSIKNNWVDEHDHVYFIFTINELKDLFNCSNDKVIKIKHELEETDLLLQKRIGLNKPNHLYLADLEVDASDVYLISKINQNNDQTLATSGIPKNRIPDNAGITGILKNRIPVIPTTADSQTLATSGIPKNRNNLDKDLKEDTSRYNIETQKLSFSTTHFSATTIDKQNQDLITHADDFLTDEDGGWPIFLEPTAVKLLSFWCQTPQQMHRFIGIILNAKYSVEQDHQDLNVHIFLDNPELKTLITKTLRRYFNVLRSDERHVQDVENYLYGTMKNLFGTWWNKQVAENIQDDQQEESNHNRL